MLHCADRTFYVGHTDDLEKRIGQHELGTVPGYTSTRMPVKLVWSEPFSTREEAREVERRLKGWGRPKKLALIRGDWELISLLARGKQERASTSSAKPASVFLHPHLEHLPSEPFSLQATVRRAADRLHIAYRLTGPVDLICIPQPASSARKDGLWQQTCFEVFALLEASRRYWEFNLAPSGEWAAYCFESHRQGMEMLPISPPGIRTAQDRFSLEVKAIIPFPERPGALRLNISAVIEEKSRRKSYWALAHPLGAPDFHHPDCFTLELPPPSAS